MKKQFVQVSAHKDSNNFMHCSNLSLMANKNLSDTQALSELKFLANQYASKGYSIEWIYEDFDDAYEEMFGELFA